MYQERVHFCNGRKEKLCGMLFSPSQRGQFPAIVICHGFTSSKYTKIGLAKRVSRKGFAVFIFDASGCGESEGNFEDHTVTKYVNELKNAVDFLKKQKFVDRKRIGISGHSLGGMVALIFASKYRDAKMIIPVDAPYHMLKDKGKESHFADKRFLESWKKKGYAILDVRKHARKYPKRLSYKFVEDARKYDLSKLMKKVRCPIIVIHGNADRTVPPEHAKIIFSNAKAPKRLILVGGVNHKWKKRHENILEEILVKEFFEHLNNPIYTE